MNNKSCPCYHLDKPCNSNCSCKRPYMSGGCYNCCTYGSVEQQKSNAEFMNNLRITLEEKELFIKFLLENVEYDVNEEFKEWKKENDYE